MKNTEVGLLEYIVKNDDAEYLIKELEASHFSFYPARWVFERMKRDYENGFKYSIEYLSDLLHQKDAPDGIDQVISIMADPLKKPINRSSVFLHVQKIKESYWLKTIPEKLGQVLKLKKAEEMAKALRDLGNEVASSMGSDGDIRSLSGITDDVIETAKRMSVKKDGIVGYKFTGINLLDKLISGLSQPDFLVVAARPKMGKSSFLNRVFRYHVENKLPIYIASGENTREETVTRGIADLTGLKSDDIKTGAFFADESKERMFDKWLDVVSEKKLDDKIIIEGGHGFKLSLPDLTKKVKTYKRLYGIKVFCIDRVGLFKEFSDAKRSEENAVRNDIASTLRRLSNEEGVSIILFSQVNAKAEDTSHKRPQAHHVYGATALQANARKILILYRPEHYGINVWPDVVPEHEGEPCKGQMEIFSVLNNDGELGSIVVKFDGPRQTISDLEEKVAASDFVNESPVDPGFSYDSGDDEDEDENFVDDEDIPF